VEIEINNFRIDKMKPKRYLTNAKIRFISLVNKGANKETIIYKSDVPEGEGVEAVEQFIEIKKSDSSKQLVYGIVYAPDKVDTHGDAMTAEEIEKAAFNFLASGKTDAVDTQHTEKGSDGYVVESYLVKKGDEIFPDSEGAWAVTIKVTNEDTWDKVTKGEITGLSMSAIVQPVIVEKNEEEPKGFIQSIRDFFGIVNKSESFTDRFEKSITEKTLFILMDFVWGIFWDTTITDKKTAIMAAIDEMKSKLDVMIEKSEDKVDNDVLQLYSDAIQYFVTPTKKDEKVEKHEAPTIPEPDPVETAVQKAVEPLLQTINQLTQRLESIENTPKGSQAINIEVKKSQSPFGMWS
jgi:hypothetical protein